MIAENVEPDPIKKSRIANFLKEYWGVKKGSNQMRHFDASKTTKGIGEVLGENERSLQRLMKLNELIPQLQRLVSDGKLGTTAALHKPHTDVLTLL